MVPSNAQHKPTDRLDASGLMQIAFSSISIALKYYLEEMKTGLFNCHHGVIEKKEGSAPNDPNSYRLRDYIKLSARL